MTMNKKERLTFRKLGIFCGVVLCAFVIPIEWGGIVAGNGISLFFVGAFAGMGAYCFYQSLWGDNDE